MKSDTADIPLLRTKPHRPPVVAGHLHRQRLLDRLEKNLEYPLTLVSAPAGYGKTALLGFKYLKRGFGPNVKNHEPEAG